MAGMACMGTDVASADNCTITIDQRCNDGSSGRGVAHWSDDGSMGGGIIQISGTSGCSSSYDVTYSRL
jgi:hypothetical protein